MKPDIVVYIDALNKFRVHLSTQNAAAASLIADLMLESRASGTTGIYMSPIGVCLERITFDNRWLKKIEKAGFSIGTPEDGRAHEKAIQLLIDGAS